MDKLNNLIKFKDFSTFKMKVENQPGKKVLENVQSFDKFDEGFFTDNPLGNKIRRGAGFSTKDEKFAAAEAKIEKHPTKSKIYADLKKENPDMANKYVMFFIKNPEGYPKWTGSEWIDTAKYSYSNAPDLVRN